MNMIKEMEKEKERQRKKKLREKDDDKRLQDEYGRMLDQ